MKRRYGLFAALLVIGLLFSVNLGAAQEGGIPFPADASDAYVLYPDVIQDAPMSAGALQQRYILLAKSGNILSVTANMSAPGLITRLELVDATGVVLVEQPADATSAVVALSYEVAAEGWYYVTVSLGAANPADFYTLTLTGTTKAIYDIFGAGAPPAVPGAHLVTATAQISGELAAEAASYLIPLAEGDALTLSAEGASQPRLRFTQYEAGAAAHTIIAEAPQAGAAATYTFNSDKPQWVKVDVEPAQAGAFALAVTLPRASGMVKDLGVEGGVGAGAVAGELCGGVPARFAMGDMLVVSPEGDNLLLLSDYTGSNEQSIGLAVTGNRLEVLDPPVCHYSAFMQQDTWFWYVYSYSHDVNGWVPDGFGEERWVCAETDPNCNQAATCETEPYAFNVGDTIVVSQVGDDLQLMRYPGATEQVIALVVTGDRLQVLAEPVCYYSDWHAGGLWYWNVFAETDNLEGWIVQGTAEEIWVCPEANPVCDQ